MANRLNQSWPLFRGPLSDADSSRHLALGVALGMIIGLLPKDSIIVLLVFVALILSRANLFTSACSAIAFSLVSGLLTPLTHSTGRFVLTLDFMEPIWARLSELPLMPWTRFDNTIVMGSLIVGLLAAVPVYRGSEKYFNAYGQRIFDRMRNSPPARWLVGPVAKTTAPILNEEQL